MERKDFYTCYAVNEQGASMTVTRETSIRACENEARRTLGSGWEVHIEKTEIDGDGQSVMGIFEVKKFTIR